MRLPIRARLTAWYVVLLAAIIVVLGTFVVLQLRADLLAQEDRELRDSWAQIARDYEEEGLEDFADVSRMVMPPGGAAQVLDSDGRLLATWSESGAHDALLPPGARADVLLGRTRVLSVGEGAQQFRVRAAPVTRLGQRHALVIGESLHEVKDAVRRLVVLLVLAGPAALAATAAGGWWLARKALLPVDRMTSRAEQVGIDRLDERIAVPDTADELSHLAITLNEMLDRLEQGVAEKQRLVADASHELRTPLAVMRAELDVSLRQDNLPPAERTVLESVREEVDRMSRTVDNLLTLAQADEGRLELLTARVDIGDAIEAAARPLRPLAEAKAVRLELGAEEAGNVQADAQRLHQALTNLIENAIKFTPPGGTVRAGAWRRAAEVGVTVTDSGPGIPPEARAHVFDRFVRLDHARGRDGGGSGLGLAICREIADAHGGRVWVESEPGRGSAFSLALPAELGPERSPRAAASSGLQTGGGEVTLRDS